MNRLPGIILVTLLFAAALFSQQQKSIKPASIYRLSGVTVESPNQPGWELQESNEALVTFQKEAEDELVDASLKVIRTNVIENDEELLKSLEALKEKELRKLKKDSVHFNYVRFKNAPCVQYDGIFTRHNTAPKFKYFNFRGYLCRAPESKHMVVQIEFSNYSNLRGLSKELFSLSDEFFEKTTFSTP